MINWKINYLSVLHPAQKITPKIVCELETGFKIPEEQSERVKWVSWNTHLNISNPAASLLVKLIAETCSHSLLGFSCHHFPLNAATKVQKTWQKRTCATRSFNLQSSTLITILINVQNKAVVCQNISSAASAALTSKGTVQTARDNATLRDSHLNNRTSLKVNWALVLKNRCLLLHC